MPWGKLDDTLHRNAKVWSFSHGAFRVWMYAISYCNEKRRTDPDGTLSAVEARTMCGLAGVGVAAIRELVARGGFDRAGDGFVVHDFHLYAPRTDETAAERQRRHRELARNGRSPDAPRPDHIKEVPPRDVTASVTRDSTVTVTVKPVTKETHVPCSADALPHGPPPAPSEHAGEEEAVVAFSVSGGAAHKVARTRAKVASTLATERKPSRSGRAEARARRALLGALEDAFGAPANSVEGKQRRDAATALLASAPPVTPAEVPRLVERWDKDHDPELCTPMALARNLTQLRGPPAPPNGRGPRSGRRAPADDEHLFRPGAWDAPPAPIARYLVPDPVQEPARSWLDPWRRSPRPAADELLTLADVRAAARATPAPPAPLAVPA